MLSASPARAAERTPAMLDELLKQLDTAPPSPGDSSELLAKIDAVAAQKDASVSRLFWYTDLSEALKVAAAEHKPVLSLRLLGRLDESLSCANSRLFRTTLYANRAVADYLRQHYVLHWQSVRSAPKVTVDFGDGRRIETTITGNSIHYVLSPEGKVIDAIPGLFGPARFLELLQADASCTTLADAPPAPPVTGFVVGTNPAQAVRSTARTASKTAMELPALKAVTDQPLLTATSPPLGLKRIDLDDQSLTLIHSKLPRGTTPAQADACIAALRRTIALDQLINDTRLRPVILRHVADHSGEPLDSLNAWVYAEVFVAPLGDPWSGLNTPTTFNGLDNGGLIEPK